MNCCITVQSRYGLAIIAITIIMKCCSGPLTQASTVDETHAALSHKWPRIKEKIQTTRSR